MKVKAPPPIFASQGFPSKGRVVYQKPFVGKDDFLSLNYDLRIASIKLGMTLYNIIEVKLTDGNILNF